VKITIKAWAEKHYDPPPSRRIVSGWRIAGCIHPPPEKVGRSWFVDENAQRVQQLAKIQDSDPVIEEIWNGRSAA